MDRRLDTSAMRADSGGAVTAGRALDAAVVLPAPGQGSAYAMYRVDELAADGAALSGGLLLEKGEELTLELRLPEAGAVRARARVVDIAPGRSGMRVAFVGLEEADRQRLSRHFT